MEIGENVLTEKTGETDINLDACADANEEVINHIYNMVRARLDSLNQPLGRSEKAAPMNTNTPLRKTDSTKDAVAAKSKK